MSDDNSESGGETDVKSGETGGIQRAFVQEPWVLPLGDSDRDSTSAPIVTIFGAGVTGLTAAHELIERGFGVQVVEPAESADHDYQCEVGGMARNQFGRTKADLKRVHPYFYDRDPDIEDTDDNQGSKPKESTENPIDLQRLRALSKEPVRKRYPTPQHVLFERGQKLNLMLKDRHGRTNEQKIQVLYHTLRAAYKDYEAQYADDLHNASLKFPAPPPKPSPRMRLREILLVEIRGYTDADKSSGENRDEGKLWATQVRSKLLALNTSRKDPISNFENCLIVVGAGEGPDAPRAASTEARARECRVEVRIVERLVPGEHGYRFFPAFYRHLLDTMNRTPILDERGRETGRTTFDHLVSTPSVGLALADDKRPREVPTRRVRSLEELRRLLLLLHRQIGVSERDMLRFTVRIAKFVTSSSRRRREKFQNESWWDFLGGPDEDGYSDKMKKFLRETPQALVAMGATETDARTQGDIYCQMLLEYMGSGEQTGMTLNGPTSSAWLDHWKAYLARQGVRFFVGQLDKLEWENKPKPRFIVPSTVVGSRRLSDPVDIRMLGDDDGVYTLWINRGSFSVEAHGMTRQGIAKALLKKLPTGNSPEAPVTVALLPDQTTLRITPVLSAQEFLVTVIGASAQAHSIEINAVTYSYLRAGTQQPNGIAIGLKARIESVPGAPVTVALFGKAGSETGLRLTPNGAGVSVKVVNADNNLDLTRGRELHVEVANEDGNLGIVAPPRPERAHHSYFTDPDFFILATPFQHVSALVWDLWRNSNPRQKEKLGAAFKSIMEFDKQGKRRNESGVEIPLVRDAFGRPPHEYPLRDLSGVQYYFPNNVRFGKGHTYFIDAPWGLSSISQMAHWRVRHSAESAFLGQVSVDIGDWYEQSLPRPKPEDRDREPAKTAWHSSRQEIAEEAWAQVLDGLPDRVEKGKVDPSYYHLDTGISFGSSSHRVFRGKALLKVGFQNATGGFVIRVNGLTAMASGADGASLPQNLTNALNSAARSTHGGVTAREAKPAEVERPEAQIGNIIIESTVAPEQALVGVLAADGAEHRIQFGERSISVPGQPEPDPSDPAPDPGLALIAQKLVAKINATEGLAVTAALSGTSGVLLTPKSGKRGVDVRVDPLDKRMNLVFGSSLDVRLTSVNGKMWFGNPGDATPLDNTTPFLINNVGQWQLRPGVRRPEKPTAKSASADNRKGEKREIGYGVSNVRWVLAGTYAGTHTRMTTMEAANESARHAVNAILRKLWRVEETNGDYNAARKLLGDSCDIFDIEKHEFEDVEALKRLDEELVAAGLPHFIDILGITEFVDSLPVQGESRPNTMTNLLRLLSESSRSFSKDWDFRGGSLEEIGLRLGSKLISVLKDQAGPVADSDRAHRWTQDGLVEMLQKLLSRSGR